VRDARGALRQGRKQQAMTHGLDVRIGINPISWSNDDLPSLGGETSLETALSEGKAIGYEGFELGNKFPREPKALASVLGLVLGLAREAAFGRRGDQAVGQHVDLLARPAPR
jgi:inosose dehydratase